MSAAGSNPFVGLRAFESDESLLFFGRQEQTRDLLQRLHDHHFVAVIGSSGSGKSSIIKAGLIPALKGGYLVNDRDRWMITTMKPGQSPLCNLADAVLDTAGNPIGIDATVLEQQVKEEGAQALLDILEPLWGDNANVFLLIDQFEELFRFSLDQPEVGRKDEAIDFVNILLELAAHKALPIYTVITMRSDFIGDCAAFYGLPEAINQSQYLVPRLTRIQLKSAIEGPVRLSDGKINPGLLTRLLNDAQVVKDELPLLQHALMRIWDRDYALGGNRELDLKDYESIGGLENALSNHADEALTGMEDAELQLTKRLFQALTTVDENERKVRRPIRLSDLEAETGSTRSELISIIERFAADDRSFLIVSEIKDKDDLLLDISHESLIRQWKTLNEWVNEETEASKVLLRLNESAELYRKKQKNLLSDNELHQAMHWRNTFQPKAAWARRYHADFEYAITYLEQSEQEEKRARVRKIRNRAVLLSLVLIVLLFVAAFAIYVYQDRLRQQRELALNYWKSSLAARKSNQLLESLHYLAESADITDDPTIKSALYIDAEASLPQAVLSSVVSVNDVITDVQFDPQGKFVLLALNDGTAQIVDPLTGGTTAILQHRQPVNSAEFSRDGNLILTASNDHDAILWDARTHQKRRVFAHPAAVLSGTFSPDGTMVLTAGADSTIRLLDVNSGKQVFFLQQDAAVIGVLFSPGGESFAAVSADNRVSVFDTRSRKLSTIIENMGVRVAAFTPDGKNIVVNSSDSSIRFCDALNGTVLNSYKQEAIVSNLAFNKSGDWLLAGGKDGNIRLIDPGTGLQVGAVMKHEGPVYGLAFAIDGKRIATGGWDKSLRIWQLLPTQQRAQTRTFTHSGVVKSGVVSADEKYVLTASADSTARVWHLDSTSNPPVVLQHRGFVNSAVFDKTSTLILTASTDSTAAIWSVQGKLLHRLPHQAAVNHAAFGTDNSRFLTVSRGNLVRVWEYSTAAVKCIDSFTHNAAINSAMLHPDKQSILIGCEDSAAYRVDLVSGRILTMFRHDDQVRSAVFSSDGGLVLTSSWDMTAHIWDATTGRQAGPSMKHRAAVNSAVFSDDEKFVVTSGWDRSAHLWNVLTRQEIGKPVLHEKQVNSAMLSPGGKWMITACNNRAEIWPVAGDLDLPARLFHLQAKTTSGVRFDVATDEAQCIPPDEWLKLSDQYKKDAAQHHKVCKYRAFNFWGRIHPEVPAPVQASR
ncbi:WD40 repeat domain-containing protein [Segetibacter sp. 3557_3]|uniref:WD40 repeat domain-containing protein n=1 Tax=Segetibacter sp. 3557_3 TaxID=2547429 RepID=UPI00105903CF|nr:WD40 repeat domain-containing protein [Segetibacter sp. 3557_3]TDH24193.1 WD40 repeat domain-containing protein [Segetibacter sp. 3557_3]